MDTKAVAEESSICPTIPAFDLAYLKPKMVAGGHSGCFTDTT